MKKPNISTKPRCANTGTSAGGCGKRLAVVSPKTIDCTRPKMAANATPSASSKMGVAQGCCFMAVVKIRNSLAKTPTCGVHALASAPNINPQPTVGLKVMRPRMLSMSCEPAFCVACPTAKKIDDLVSECTVICKSAAKFATGPPIPNANAMMPMCSMEEYANNRLTSRCRHRKNAARTTESNPKPINMRPGRVECSEPSTSTLQRTTAYMATLTSSPDKPAEIGVGPSACASGNQLCSGARPTLVPYPTSRNTNAKPRPEGAS